ncbi:MAG: hypothetical protein Q7S20_13040 [Gemmatimonadaceae bacterium]|nr:hypothetical protein [Gemmatimonadaceae bacterium]
MDANAFVEKTYGKGIFTLPQASVTVPIRCDSVLDAHAFSILLRKGELTEWARLLDAPPGEMKLSQRDYSVIWHIGTQKKRDVEIRLTFRDWQSKLRSEMYFEERKREQSEWEECRTHWQYMLRIGELEETYPYLTFARFDEERQEESEFFDNEDGEPLIELGDGTQVYGTNVADEYHQYEFLVGLNAVGDQMLSWVKTLQDLGVIQVSESVSEFIDVAPWHWRGI